MSEEDQDQKTEDPTSKRLDEAREKGQLPISREISSWTLFFGILIVVAWLGKPLTVNMMQELRVFIAAPESLLIDDQGLQTLVFSILLKIAMLTGLVFLVLSTMIILGFVAQNGFFWSPDLLKVDFMRLNPVPNIKKLFSTHALFEAGKSILKFIFLGTLAFWAMLPIYDNIQLFTDRPLMSMIDDLHSEAVHLVTRLLVAYGIIAIADLLYQRYEYFKQLKMTKTEVKDEYKQMEGDPAVKARLRQIRLEKSRKRMMSRVPKADVVITNPTHYAVALQYDGEKAGAPVVVAKGINTIALKIREIAEENKVPIVSNPPLARVLHDTVELDHQIAPEQYKAVAEVISYVYRLKKRIFK